MAWRRWDQSRAFPALDGDTTQPELVAPHVAALRELHAKGREKSRLLWTDEAHRQQYQIGLQREFTAGHRLKLGAAVLLHHLNP